MASPLDSAVGVAIQNVKGTPITAHAKFMYSLFERATISPIEVIRPYPRLAGSARALPRGSVKTGVYSGGDMDVLVGPEVLGYFLYGIMGEAAEPTAWGNLHGHVFTIPTDEFSVPYLTIRRKVAGLWYEQFQDARITGFTLTAPAADMVRFNIALAALNPQIRADGADWVIGTYIDDGDAFLSCVGSVTFGWGTYCATNIVLTQVNTLAIDEEWCVGSYYPADLTMGGRAFMIQCDIKADAELFGKATYDPDYVSGEQTWTPEILSEASFEVQVSTQADEPEFLKVSFDSAHSNIDWTIAPVGVRAADNVQTMRLTGIVKQSAGEQIEWVLVNDRDTQYAYSA